MGERYRGRIRSWEIWNEQNTRRFWITEPDPEGYMRLIGKAAERLRDLDEGNFIVLGGICGNDVDRLVPGIPRGYFRRLVALGVDDLVDAHAIHPYTLGCYLSLRSREATLAGILERIDNFLRAFPDLKKPVWISEIGLSRTWIRLDWEELARLYQQLLNECAKRGLVTYLWCLQDFDDACYVLGNPEKSFGLVDARLETPNPIWRALRETFGGGSDTG